MAQTKAVTDLQRKYTQLKESTSRKFVELLERNYQPCVLWRILQLVLSSLNLTRLKNITDGGDPFKFTEQGFEIPNLPEVNKTTKLETTHWIPCNYHPFDK